MTGMNCLSDSSTRAGCASLASVWKILRTVLTNAEVFLCGL